MTARRKVGIVGAGIGGLATAIRLARRNFAVDLYEAAPRVGGKVAELRQEGYRFDMGPSLFTQPHYLEALFEACGKRPEDYFDYHQLASICRYFFPDGNNLTAWSDPERLAQEFEDKIGEPAENVRRFLKKSARIYELTAGLFLERSMHKAGTFLRGEAFKTLFNIRQVDAFRNMNQANESYFDDPRTVQFFNRYATYNGSDPFKAPATLNVIAHLEHNIGAFFLKGGMRSLSNALEKLARDVGVQIHTNSKVDRITVNEGSVKALEVNGQLQPYDLVVSNMDVVPTYRRLMPDQRHPEKILNQPRSSSALIFYWGMKGVRPALDLHNIFFSQDYKREFDQLFNQHTLGNDPTVYLYISSKADSADAPNGCENWFAMINAPHDKGQDWEQLRARARKAILAKLEGQLGESLEEKIETEACLDPLSIQSRTQSHLGALYGNSSNNRFAAFMRHPNFSRKIKGLYFCGGSVHPGGGIPLCLLSAKIVDDLIK